MQSQKLAHLKFVDLPSPAALQTIDEQLTKRALARRRQRVSKLTPYLQSIKHCIDRGYSLQRTCLFLESAHGLAANRSTLFRFMSAHPLLLQSTSTARQYITTDPSFS